MPYQKTSEQNLFPDGCSASTEQEFKQFWDETAEKLDDFVAEHAPESHKMVPQLLLSYEQKFNVKLPRDGYLLDVASGTGRAAQGMEDLFGFRGIMDGIEGSENMVAIARRKNIYRDIFVEFIDESIQTVLPKDYYDICIACGAFGKRTIKAARIKDVLELVKCGGFMAIVSSSHGFKTPYKGATLSTMELIADWEKQGLVKLVFTPEFEQYWAEWPATGLLLQKL